MRAAVALRNVVGETLHVLAVAVVPLHRDFNGDAGLFAARKEHVFVNRRLRFIDVLNKALDATGVCEVFALACTLIDQLNLHTAIQERELTNALGQTFEVIFNVNEGFNRRQKVHFGTATVTRFTCNFQW